MSFYGFGDSVMSGMERTQKLIANEEQMKRQRAYLNMQQQYAQMAQDRWDVQKQKEQLQIQDMQNKLNEYEITNNQRRIAQGLLSYSETGNTGMLNDFISNSPKVKQAIIAGMGGSVFKSPSDYTPEALQRMQGYDEHVTQSPKDYMVVVSDSGKETLVPAMYLSFATGATNESAKLHTQASQQLAILQQRKADAARQAQIQQNPELDPTQKQELLAKSAFNDQNINKAILSPNPIEPKKVFGEQTPSLAEQIEAAQTPQELFNLTLTNPKYFKSGSQESLAVAAKVIPLIEQQFTIDNPGKEFSFSAMPKEYQQRIAHLLGQQFNQFQKDMIKEKGFGTQDAIVKAIAAVNQLDPDKVVPYFQSIQNDVSKFLGVNNLSPEDLKLQHVHHALGLVTDIISRERSGAALNMQEVNNYKDAIGSLSKNQKYILSGLKTQLDFYINKLEHYKTIYGSTIFELAFGKKLERLKQLSEITEQGITGKLSSGAGVKNFPASGVSDINNAKVSATNEPKQGDLADFDSFAKAKQGGK